MEANLKGANLSLSDLTGANLTGANLTAANLSFAKCHGTILNSATLNQANLFFALGLNKKQITKAKKDDKTKLPAHFTENAERSKGKKKSIGID